MVAEFLITSPQVSFPCFSTEMARTPDPRFPWPLVQNPSKMTRVIHYRYTHQEEGICLTHQDGSSLMSSPDLRSAVVSSLRSFAGTDSDCGGG